MKKAELEVERARLREENANLRGQLFAKQAALDTVVQALCVPKYQPLSHYPAPQIIPNQGPTWIDPTLLWPNTRFTNMHPSYCNAAAVPSFGTVWVGETFPTFGNPTSGSQH